MNAEAVIGSELEPDERLIWHGQPRQGLLLRGPDWVLVLFGLLWWTFLVFYFAAMVIDGDQLFVGTLFGIPFLAVGLYLMPGRFLIDARLRSRTYYGLTDRRAIIVSGLFSTTVKSLLRKTLSDVSVEQRRDGSGTIFFGHTNVFDAMYAGMSWPGYEPTPRFEGIPDVREVYRLLLRNE